ncbi:MAG: CHRD domain-containing protein, partial [Acidobacteria bacterium]|nr:CHRD domain-containing protein [Acidobacteriota bacterium]
MKRSLYLVIALCCTCGLFSFNGFGQLINELDINPGGTDQPCEYVELRGTPGAIIENVHFVAFEGDAAPSGTADFVVTFGSPGPAFGSNGLIVITGTAACGARTYAPETTRLQTTLLDAANGLENGTISFLLISTASAITANTDYDTDNNGTLEALPAGATILDAVAWTDGDAGDIMYGGTNLTATGGVIGASTRFPTNTTANSAAAWYAGAMTGTNDANTYSPTIRTANFPSDGALTPGATNVGTVGGGGPGVTKSFTGYLNGAQEVPTNASAAKGFGRVTLNEAETSITVSISYGSAAVPLSSNVIAGHIHGPAAPGVNAPVLFDLAPAGGAAFGSVNNATFAITPAQVANLKAGLFYFNIHTVNNSGGEIRGQILVPRSVVDINGDGRTDHVVVRAAGGAGSQLTWLNSLNDTGPAPSREWGVSGDQIIAGDYDGDGIDDETVFRPSNATFYIIQSATLTARIDQFGQTGDNPRIVGDYDGDGRDDLAVYRSGAQSFWYYKTSPTAVYNSVGWGQTGDFPAPGDYDGDGKSDFVVQRPTGGNGVFWKQLSGGSMSAEQFGLASDGVVPGDYDGDGKTDVAVFRTTGGFYVWDFEPSGTAGSTVVSDTWG